MTKNKLTLGLGIFQLILWVITFFWIIYLMQSVNTLLVILGAGAPEATGILPYTSLAWPTIIGFFISLWLIFRIK